MDLEQTHIYGASIYQSLHDTGILSEKINEESIRKSIYLETSMGEGIYKFWGFKT